MLEQYKRLVDYPNFKLFQFYSVLEYFLTHVKNASSHGGQL